MSARTFALFRHYWCAGWAMLTVFWLVGDISRDRAASAALETLCLLVWLKWANDSHLEATTTRRGTP